VGQRACSEVLQAALTLEQKYIVIDVNQSGDGSHTFSHHVLNIGSDTDREVMRRLIASPAPPAPRSKGVRTKRLLMPQPRSTLDRR
jgi:hypothetical protein